MAIIGTPQFLDFYTPGTDTPWLYGFTPSAGSELFLLVRWPDSRTLDAIACNLDAGGSAGTWNLVSEAVGNIVERNASLYHLSGTIAAAQTLRIDFSGNASGACLFMEYEAGATVEAGSFAQADNFATTVVHNASANDRSPSGVDVYASVWATGNANFRQTVSPNDTWTRIQADIGPPESYQVDRSGDWYRINYTAASPPEIYTFTSNVSSRDSGGVSFHIAAGSTVQPPQQNTLTPNFPITQGATGTIRDVSGDWSVGTGGTGPLTYAATNFASGFSITTTGQIQSDGTPGPGDYTLQRYQVDDAANNGPTLSNEFTITVNPASATLTTPPLKDDKGVAVTGRTGITIVIYPGTSSTATATLVLENQSQQPDGTLVVSSTSLATGTKYTMAAFEPKTDDAEAYRGIFRLTAT